MANRSTLTQADLDRAARAAAKVGMVVTVTGPDGKTYTFAPFTGQAGGIGPNPDELLK